MRTPDVLLMQRCRITAAVLSRWTFARAYTKLVAWSEEDLAKARQWYRVFSNNPAAVIPHDLGEVSYARSSGPGGQNVNKLNTKAQLRLPIDQLLPLLPSMLHQGVRSSRYYATNSDALLIQADDSRKQAANKDACYRKLSELVDEVFKANVPGETTEEQKEKVQKLQKSENEARLRNKKKQSSKKAGRSKSFDD